MLCKSVIYGVNHGRTTKSSDTHAVILQTTSHSRLLPAKPPTRPCLPWPSPSPALFLFVYLTFRRPAMAGGEKNGIPSPIFSLLLSLLLLPPPPSLAAGKAPTSPAASVFSPSDSYLLDCGSPKSVQLPDGRTFRSEPQSSSFLSTDEDIRISAAGDTSAAAAGPIYYTARVFSDSSTYSFFISKPGRHWIRLHFLPFPTPNYNLSAGVFSVNTEDFVLLRDFSVPAAGDIPVVKEYLISIDNERLYLTFKPKRGSFAFINAVEVVSAPDSLISTSATGMNPISQFSGLNNYALQVVSRINVGGPAIPPENDTLSRLWQPDSFLKPPAPVDRVSVSPGAIKFPEDGSVTPIIAPAAVYATADSMTNANVSGQMFNITWDFPADPNYFYLIRLHFCDIVSKSLNTLYFNVFINRMLAIPNLDLSSLTSGHLATAYFKDFVVAGNTLVFGNISVQISPPVRNEPGLPDAILNGIEIMRMSNNAGSLDGPFSVDGSYHGGAAAAAAARRKVVAAVGLVIGFAAMGLVALMFIRWRRRPEDWGTSKSFSSWLLPLHITHSGGRKFMSKFRGGGTGGKGGSSSSSSKSRFSGSHKSKSGCSSYLAAGALGLGRYFTFSGLEHATGSFDEKNVIGVGGFGKVYIGVLEDGTKVAVKRGNPSSDQGINEFQTEIEMLSKLRHRHLVSLIGYCDENKEMILVYEFMANGPLRDHLYGGSGHTPLSWKQRLEVCIGAARGLHYLHTGAAQGIIHRDVKTTNILLDENLVAKMADFGLSKAGPSLNQTHVSTAVKGSFGYLDPEYFRRQQLTEKSDVYSFGVVLLEVLCSRPAICPALPRDQVNLAEWAMQWNRKGKMEKIVDPYLVGTVGPASLKKFVEAAEKCLADSGVNRPSMGDVLWNLEYALQLQEAFLGQSGDDDDSGDDIKLPAVAGGRLGDGEKREVGDVADDSTAAAAIPAPVFHGR
ncbi:putative receptor-like protein kinase [Apostasia shenzhenica]|uniref:Putative receptor-like protein kinase n=1 Tax=Apostasia shenzhenica TaxID=1088818 RepID=A0A2I0AAF8_9ASPA|nr:putative receptor-like protein kinase [Apostasia shenzhenica]